MSEDVFQSRRNLRRYSRAVLSLIIVSLLVPHTLMSSWSTSWLRTTEHFALVAVSWTIHRLDILTVSESYSTTVFEFPNGVALLSTLVFFPLHLIVIRTQSRFIKGITSKNATLLVIVIALFIQVILSVYSCWDYEISAFGAYPFPIFYLLNLVSVFWERQPKLV